MPTRAAAKASDGCAFVDITTDVDDLAVFCLDKGWRDQAALDAHSASGEFQAQPEEALELAIINRSIELYSVEWKQTVAPPL